MQLRVLCPWTQHSVVGMLHRPVRAGIASEAISASCDVAFGAIVPATRFLGKTCSIQTELRGRSAAMVRVGRGRARGEEVRI